ncbi:MAG: hypothetical protein WB579_19420 [Bryobacteraceae bacterium]
MKRLLIAAAAVLFGTTVIQKEVQDAECKEHGCASDLTAKVPEQPHTLEAPPDYRVPEGMVMIPSSPPYTVQIGSEEHLRWERQYGKIPASFTS